MTDPVQDLVARLALAKPLVCLDVETTGLDVAQDRVIEIGAVKIRPGGQVTTFHSLFNPGIPIKADATAKHGITDADVAAAPAFRDHAAGLGAALADCDLMAYNGRRFDIPVLQAEFARCRITWNPDGAVVDPWMIWQVQERRDLAGAIRRFAPDFTGEAGGHRAVGDVLGLIAVVLGQFEAFFPAVPGAAVRLFTPTELDDAGRDPSWIDATGKIAWNDAGVPVFTVGKHKGTAVAALPDDYVRWLNKSDFPQDVKDLVRDIRYGRIPDRTSP